ncbi:MAG TPA: hypothetical protein VKR52_05020 [Terracidiphilus sp.]|nr:hypothetical protein [Terracidiphilus sp.]
MKQEVYRFAFEEANSELKEIVGEFEQLRLRKERIEKVLEALKPFSEGNSSEVPGTEPQSYSFQQTGNGSYSF